MSLEQYPPVVVPLEVNGIRTQGLIDSGADVTVIDEKVFYEELQGL